MQQDIKDFIEAELIAFGMQFQSERRNFLSNKISASGKLSGSIEDEIDKQSRQDAIALMIAFEDYGRFIDMKRLKAVVPSGSDNAYVKMIEDWIISRGWEQKFIQAFLKKNNLQKVPPSVLTRIAWGIVIKRANGVKPRKWYNRYKSATIPNLFNTVVAGLPDITVDVMQKAFKNA
jgi:hypothetical protein